MSPVSKWAQLLSVSIVLAILPSECQHYARYKYETKEVEDLLFLQKRSVNSIYKYAFSESLKIWREPLSYLCGRTIINFLMKCGEDGGITNFYCVSGGDKSYGWSIHESHNYKLKWINLFFCPSSFLISLSNERTWAVMH